MFRFEKEMTPIVEKWLLDQGYLVMKEIYGSGWGYPDIVACKINKEKAELRIKLRQSSRQYLLYCKYNVEKNDPIEEGYERTECDFMTFDTKHVDPKSFQWYPLHDELLFFELKLKNISGVILQAINNRVYTDDSYIILPENIILNMKEKTRYGIYESGLGIISVTKEGCKVVRKPSIKESEVNIISQFNVVESFWTKWKKRTIKP